ncbi:Uncharacterised protein [Mycobacteroides abscessus subsp. massiliense]|uniref:Membrane protein n=1 Tax=Mycobacteroides abscessus subsp. bolletii 50594 TaxID=1303024 RepID=A0AB33AH09_9MYCO|nr:putative membrane protein [Mycobacteroides abscessus subsp. bolletii 50594]PVA54290.1 hypothetical protein DDJ72_18215 [Mycobacteroides abscessus]TKV37303.1 hypothetical protein CFA71_08830 [Mycobacteroides abscessus subsp. bolletii]SKG29903.1 Uncharacterised protein [Mycobacteroides abscessus subsp. massiliense]PVA94621.1 hypothetical protein DDK01_01635 [Mycobacteroides abscessus]
MRLNPKLPITLIAVGSVLMIIASIVGLISGSNLLFVCGTGAVGVMCLAISIYLYRKLPLGNHS